MQKRFASWNVALVIWYMPTALEAGWYSSRGFHVRRHRQYVRATGLPAPSTWASAASSSGVITAVACSRKSGAYCRHVSAGGLESAPPMGKNSSVGLRITWYVQFIADHSARTAIVSTTMRIARGAASSARKSRRADRQRRLRDAFRAARARLRRAVTAVTAGRCGDAMTMRIQYA